jgi:hypothetical protein
VKKLICLALALVSRCPGSLRRQSSREAPRPPPTVLPAASTVPKGRALKVALCMSGV